MSPERFVNTNPGLYINKNGRNGGPAIGRSPTNAYVR